MGFCIIYDIQDGYYAIHINIGEVEFNKDEMGIPYIDAEKPHYVDFIQITRETFDVSRKML